MFWKNIVDGYISSVSTGVGGVMISEEEYNAILEIAKNAPKPPNGYEYRLRADDLEWELVELPPEPDPDIDDAEAFDIIFGGAE